MAEKEKPSGKSKKAEKERKRNSQRLPGPLEALEGAYTPADEYFPGLIADIPVLKRKKGNPGTKDRSKYRDVIVTFDIETTRVTPEDVPGIPCDQAFCYLWALHIHHYGTFVGRSIYEFRDLLMKIEKELADTKLVIYIHNLSYEFQFMRAIYEFYNDDIFAIDKRKVLKCSMAGKFEFRCSYLHSNMSLEVYTNKMDVEHKKLSGEEFDYTKKRFPWTPIPESEMRYMLHDVWGLAEALEKEMELDGDNLYTIPLTSTGYVRRDAKRAMKAVSHKWLHDQLPDLEIYQLAREAFRGGNTHANRLYTGRILENVKSADRSSSYPDCQCNDIFPVSRFHRIKREMTVDDVYKYIKVYKRAALFRMRMQGVKLRDPYWPVPYLPRDKCRRIVNGLYDNGRIISADYLEITVTDVDFEIIISEYDAEEITVFDFCHARYGKLPDALRSVTIDYYRQKTSLKGVPGMELLYEKGKNKLNAIYGMGAQDIGKQNISFENGEWKIANEPLQDIIERNNRRAFQSYCWGCWVTAWARYRLEEGIRLAGHNLVYVDTDSVKYLGDIDWKPYNDVRIAKSRESGAFADDPSGITHYMGVFEEEKGYYQFATLGAKKYAFRYEPGGKTHTTIAGVSKKYGGQELDEYGGLERFVQLYPPFTFHKAGGNEALFNDNPPIDHITIDGQTIKIGPNTVIRESTYTLGITAEYQAILDMYGSRSLSFVDDEGIFQKNM